VHRIVIAAATLVAVGTLSACNSASDAHVAKSPAPVSSMTSASPVSTPTTRSPTTRSAATPTRSSHVVAQAAFAPAFKWSSRHVTTAELGKSWRSGCPVGASSLRAVAASFWGFDHRAHTGTLVVNVRVVSAVVSALRTMYGARFPIRQMVPIAAYGGDDNKSMAADNTSAFNCRAAVANGPKRWSMHAFGEAIDFNAVENPYTLDGRVYPPNGKPYTNRSNVRPGMVVRGSAPVRAFSAVGWGWGGNWSSSPDYQHFSLNGK
jgi:hypothetical protein